MMIFVLFISVVLVIRMATKTDVDWSLNTGRSQLRDDATSVELSTSDDIAVRITARVINDPATYNAMTDFLAITAEHRTVTPSGTQTSALQVRDCTDDDFKNSQQHSDILTALAESKGFQS